MSVTGYNGSAQHFSRATHPSSAAGRTISKASNGDIVIHNDIFKTKVSGGGFGSEMVGRQMEQAAKLGQRVDDLCGPRRRLCRLQGVAQVRLRRRTQLRHPVTAPRCQRTPRERA